MGVANNLLLVRNVQGQLGRLLFGANKRIVATNVTVNFDVIHSYDYDTSVRITENPVEQGIKVNDHRIIEPKILVMEVGVSNIVGLKDVVTNLTKGISALSTTALQAGKLLLFGNRFDSNSRVAATYSDLQKLLYEGSTFDVETPLGTFKNMMLINIKKAQDAETISVFKGTITMQELITYTTTSETLTNKAGVNSAINAGLINTVKQSIIPSGLSW